VQEPHRPRVFYGWWIVAAGFLNQAFAAALLQRSFGTYSVLLREEFGWSKTELAAAASMEIPLDPRVSTRGTALVTEYPPTLNTNPPAVMFVPKLTVPAVPVKTAMSDPLTHVWSVTLPSHHKGVAVSHVPEPPTFVPVSVLPLATPSESQM